MASTTMTEDTSLSMKAGISSRRAMVYTRRKAKAPTTMPRARFRMLPLPKSTCPMSREARAMVTMPVPMSMLTDFWLCASRQPDRPVKALATHRPTMVVKAGLMEEERTMSGLSPVARIARPSLVRRNSARNATTNATAITATKSLYCSARNVPSSRALALVNTVSVLFMFSREDPPITAMLMEYSPVLTMMPESRLSMPIFV